MIGDYEAEQEEVAYRFTKLLECSCCKDKMHSATRLMRCTYMDAAPEEGTGYVPVLSVTGDDGDHVVPCALFCDECESTLIETLAEPYADSPPEEHEDAARDCLFCAASVLPYESAFHVDAVVGDHSRRGEGVAIRVIDDDGGTVCLSCAYMLQELVVDLDAHPTGSPFADFDMRESGCCHQCTRSRCWRRNSHTDPCFCRCHETRLRLPLLWRVGVTMLRSTLLPALLCPVGICGESIEEYLSNGGVMGLPITYIGAPGIGKSSEVVEVALQLGLSVCVLSVDTLDIEDIAGIVVRDEQGKLLRLSDNQELLRLMECGEGVLFLDEINTGRSIDAALNRIVLDRQILGQKLPSTVRVVSAMNPPNLSAGGRPLRPSTANRLCHVHVKEHELNEWSDYILRPPSRAETGAMDGARMRLMERWGEARHNAATSAVGFLSHNPSKKQCVPTAESGMLSGAWPSERSWVAAINILATCIALNTDERSMHALVAGCIGEGAAVEWLAYREQYRLPSIMTLLAGEWVVENPPLDVLYAVTQGLHSYLQQTLPSASAANSREWAYLNNVLDLVERHHGQGKDVFYALLQMITGRGYVAITLMQNAGSEFPEAKAVTAKLSRLIKTYDVKVYNGRLV